MNTILGRVRSARVRLTVAEGLVWFVRGLFWLGVVAVPIIIAERWSGSFPRLVWPALGASLVLFSLVMALVRRPSLRTAAIALDRTANLDDRVSAALYVREEDSPVSRAVLRNAEDALLRAGKIRIPLGSLPLRRLAVPLLFVLGALGTPLPGGRLKGPDRVTPPSLLTLVPEPVRKEESEKLRRRAFSLEKMARETGRPELTELAEAMRKTAEELRKEELTRNEALAKLSSLEEKSRGQKDSLASKLPESLLKRLKGWGGDQPKSGEQKKADLARKLSDLSAAAGLLKEKLGQGGLSSEERAGLERQLEELSRGLGKNLGEGALGSLQSRLDRLLGEGELRNLRELEDALGDLKNALGELEMLSLLDQELDEMLAAKDEFSDPEGTCPFCGRSLQGQKGAGCKGCRSLAGGARGAGSADPSGSGEGSGGGSGAGTGGGPGRGPKGTAHDDDPTAPSRPPAPLNPGEIIGAIQFKALPEKGQLRSAYAEVYRALSPEATRALEQEEIPTGYRIHVRDYFDSIRPDKDKK